MNNDMRDPPPQGPRPSPPRFLSRLLNLAAGVAIAGAAAAYGQFCILTEVAQVVGFSPRGGVGLIALRSQEAVACGFVYVSLAIFLHVYFFWGSRPGFARAAYVSTILALIAVAATVIHLFYLLLYVN